MVKKFVCKCGAEYQMNSSLYNHIRLQHNNDLKNYKEKLELGRPKGKKTNSSDIQKKPKASPKVLECKCGSTLASEGALSNHIKLKHKNSPEFQIEKKKQGRKPKITNKQTLQAVQDSDSLETQYPTQQQNEVVYTSATTDGPTVNLYQNENLNKQLQQIDQTYYDQESEIVQEPTQNSDIIQVGECQQYNNEEEDYSYIFDVPQFENFENQFFMEQHSYYGGDMCYDDIVV